MRTLLTTVAVLLILKGLVGVWGASAQGALDGGRGQRSHPAVALRVGM